MKYAITGSTGALGSLVLKHLEALGLSPSDLIPLARDRAKAQALIDRGYGVRFADYEDPEALRKALQGVDRLLLISGNDFSHRAAQHRNILAAAASAGVKLVVYTSVAQADGSENPVAPDHRATEAALGESGIPHVILRNTWYTENFLGDLAQAGATGVLASAAGAGRIASALRDDLAEAAARVLIGEGHAGKTYELTGPEAWDFPGLAAAMAKVLGKPVAYKALSPAERKAGLEAAGLPAGVVGFLLGAEASFARGDLAKVSGDLEKILGRRPRGLLEGLKA